MDKADNGSQKEVCCCHYRRCQSICTKTDTGTGTEKIVLNITAKYNSREQGDLKPAGIPSVKGFNSRDIGKLTSPFVTEEDVKVNNDYATSLGAIATVMGSISQMTNEGASAWLTWSANLMTAIGTAIPAIEALIAAKKAESIGNAVASATQTPVVGWLLAGCCCSFCNSSFCHYAIICQWWCG